jgi:RNA polymerase-interacting CarD/CdnL/TRCF family regulator
MLMSKGSLKKATEKSFKGAGLKGLEYVPVSDPLPGKYYVISDFGFVRCEGILALAGYGNRYTFKKCGKESGNLYLDKAQVGKRVRMPISAREANAILEELKTTRRTWSGKSYDKVARAYAISSSGDIRQMLSLLCEIYPLGKERSEVSFGLNKAAEKCIDQLAQEIACARDQDCIVAETEIRSILRGRSKKPQARPETGLAEESGSGASQKYGPMF